MELIINKLKNKKKNVIFKSENIYRLNNLSNSQQKNFQKDFKKNLNFFKKNGKFHKIANIKIIKYRKHLSKKLNLIHKVKKNNNYWGIIIDTFLIDFVNCLISDYFLLSKLKKRYKYFNFPYKKINNLKIYSTSDFSKKIHEQEHFQNYFNSISLSALRIKTKLIGITEYKNNKINFFNRVKNIIIKKFFLFLIFICKPHVVFTEYFSRRFIFEIYNSKLYLFLPNSIFSEDNYLTELDRINRKKLAINATDKIDTLFNKLIYYFFPMSFLENYKANLNDFNLISNKIGSLTSSTIFRTHDKIKILAAELKNRKKNVIYKSHAPFENLRLFSYSYQYTKKYFKYFPVKYKKIDFPKLVLFKKKIKTLDERKIKIIIIFSTIFRGFCYNDAYIPSLENHPFFSSDIKFFKKLNNKLKNKTFIKPFPRKDTFKLIDEFWKLSNNDKKKIIKQINFFNKLENSSIFILNEFSTKLFDCILNDIPFLLIYGNIKDQLKKPIISILLKLKKLNLFFETPDLAANYLNNNFKKINSNWNLAIKDKSYIKIKKYLINNLHNEINRKI